MEGALKVERSWDEDRLLSTHARVEHDAGLGARPYIYIHYDTCTPRVLASLKPGFPLPLAFHLATRALGVLPGNEDITSHSPPLSRGLRSGSLPAPII